MSISRKAEKRQKRKEKKRKELEAKLIEEKVKFDIIKLLEVEQLDTKPNMAKFLKEHVEMIRGFCSNKIQFYPTFKYQLSRIFVKFLDGHELIYDMNSDGKFAPIYYLYYKTDEEQINDKDIPYVKQFFDFILQFKFVY